MTDKEYLEKRLKDQQICKEQAESLKAKDPSLFEDVISINFGPGWYNLLDNLLIKIITIKGMIPDTTFEVDQIKEKFGTLRFYYTSNRYDLFRDLVKEAEALSAITCEECGKSGTLREGGWLLTLCEKCQKERR